MANIYSCHMDPAAWEEPDKFKPERWIDADGKLINHAAYLPFSIGELPVLSMHFCALRICEILEVYYTQSNDVGPETIASCIKDN